MPKYIDADALTARLKILYEDDWNQNVCTSWANAYSYCEELVEEQPTADVVEVVRCKDCKWKQGSECVRFADIRPFGDDFCSRGERREDDKG